ncbi:EAL domain-containing protein [Parasphingopyxis sp. CP4]|uniref:EAL domain-containing protein n=1 Tax=Parasphingopyxis sp. CP4 TaxID=2724527 RepID=UPI0015A2C0EB|nr:EAL domain-containing protein [Parasphingopyxis sp. CP4]QLC22285.1 EAL domain-containing protein [Parasphingopyxis sp. CP4]
MHLLHSIRKRLFGYHGLVLAAALVAAFSALTPGATDSAELALDTVRDSIRSQPASGTIAIVEIDAQSLAEIDSWPWPRGVHGQLVDQLNAAGAEMIAFDIDFSSQSDPEEDQEFADALGRSDALVMLPAFRQVAGSGNSDTVYSEPIAILRDNAFLAAVNIQADQSGMVRRALVGVETNGLPRPSIASMLSNTQGFAHSDFPIDFAIDPNTIPRISYADIVAGRADPDAINGMTLLVGATAIEMGDRYGVPGHGVLPGVVIQAVAAETLIAGGIPAEYGPEIPLLIALVGVLVLVGPGATWIRSTSFAASGITVLVLPLVLEASYQATIAIVPALAMLFATAAAGSTLVALRKYRRTALEDSVSGLPNQAALVRQVSGDGQTTIVVGRIQGFSETAALLSSDEIGMFFHQLSRRIGIAAQGRIYRISESMMAWRCDDMCDEDLSDHLDAIAMMMRTPILLGTQRVDANMFLGVASGAANNAHALITGAGVAAERATTAGHRWERYIEGDDADGRWNLALLGELDDAMANKDLRVAFQPKFDIATGKIIGAEGLVRWQHPVRGLIPPDSFIPLVEDRGRIDDLTLFTVDRTLEVLSKWKEQGITLGLSVNVSATLLDDRKFMDSLLTKVEQSAIDPSRLTVEITESAAMDDADSAIAAMHMMRDWGISLSVDDYGTGQSTLSYLKHLPVDEIKIDKSFVLSVQDSSSDRILIRSTIELAHDLGLKVVAEGIEDEATLAILKELGCDVGQGYLIGKAMPQSDLEIMVREDRPLALGQAA